MRRSGTKILVTVLLPILLAAAPVFSSSGATAHDGDGEFAFIDEIATGDRCVGLSVFQGTEIEEFELEIIGVVRGVSPGSDLILARAEGELLEKTGIMQGMSGSPVYKDGRLIGAISSAWPFCKDPIAGITPIEEMLRAYDMLDAMPTSAGASSRNGRRCPAAANVAACERCSPSSESTMCSSFMASPNCFPILISRVSDHVVIPCRVSKLRTLSRYSISSLAYEKKATVWLSELCFSDSTIYSH